MSGSLQELASSGKWLFVIFINLCLWEGILMELFQVVFALCDKTEFLTEEYEYD